MEVENLPWPLNLEALDVETTAMESGLNLSDFLVLSSNESDSSSSSSKNSSNSSVQLDSSMFSNAVEPPVFDNTILKQMKFETNCLMTNQVRKLRAFIPSNLSQLTWEMLIICSNPKPFNSNFGESFPRSLGTGTFDSKGIFSIPFSQQTTSNNKQKSGPLLEFAVEFRSTTELGIPISFRSEWFHMVCQNTRAKKRLKKDLKDGNTNIKTEAVSPTMNTLQARKRSAESSKNSSTEQIQSNAFDSALIDQAINELANANGNGRPAFLMPSVEAAWITVVVNYFDIQQNVNINVGRIRVPADSDLSLVRSVIKTELAEFFGNYDIDALRFIDSRLTSPSTGPPVLIALNQESKESLQSHAQLFNSTAFLTLSTSLSPTIINAVDSNKQKDSKTDMKVLRSSLESDAPKSSYDNILRALSQQQLYHLFGVVRPDLVTPDKMSRFAKTFGSSFDQAYKKYNDWLRNSVFGDEVFENWFLGFCSRVEAEGYLNNQPKKTIILRFSSEPSKGIALSIREDAGTVHGTLTLKQAATQCDQKSVNLENCTFIYRKSTTLGNWKLPFTYEAEYTSLKKFVQAELVPRGFQPFVGILQQSYCSFNNIIDPLNQLSI
mmetsp:Transcript_26442/g.37228  ORF Transcript_26442/g.37228 Transcript_26442/m.37228 type:complete len:608 (-) Transcript_26442:45-1868(-)